MSTAPNAFNDITRKLLAAGFQLKEPLFARNGMGRQYDGLTEAEAEAAAADSPRLLRNDGERPARFYTQAEPDAAVAAVAAEREGNGQ